MPAALIRRTAPFTPEQIRLVSAQETHQAIRVLANSWSSYVAVGGNVSRARRTVSFITAQAAEFDLPVTAEVPNDVRTMIQALGLIPADLRDGNLGYCVTTVQLDGVDTTEELPSNAPLPYRVVGRHNETQLLEGMVKDRTAALALKRKIAVYGMTQLDMFLGEQLIETFA